MSVAVRKLHDYFYLSRVLRCTGNGHSALFSNAFRPGNREEFDLNVHDVSYYRD